MEAVRACNLVRAQGVAIALLPGALTIYLAFEAGGYFVGPTAVAVIVLFLALVVRILVTSHPGNGVGALVAVAVGTFALFGVWTLASGEWSDAPGRALIEFDRVLLYLLALLLFASLGGEAWRVRWIMRGMGLAAVVVCGAGLTSRLRPDLWPVTEGFLSARLDYPLTYVNSVGLLAAVGIVICLGMTSSERESPLARVLGAAALPVLGSTLLLTLSRGAIAAGALGLIIVMVLGRPRALLAGLVAAVPATVIAVTRTYQGDLLLSDNPLTRAAREQGEHIAVVVLLCAAGAALVRALLLASDGVAANIRLRVSTRRLVLGAGAAALVVIVAAGAVAVDVRTQYDRFVNSSPVTSDSAPADDRRSRLAQVQSNGRIDFWRVGFDEFKEIPLRGRGAGTYELSWERDRPNKVIVRDAHSLYAEVIAELGLVGLGLLVATLLAIILAAARRVHGPDRALFATALAAVVTWTVSAGADWHWEMPAVTLWLFALGGALLAREPESSLNRPILALIPRFAIAGVLCAVMAVVPLKLHGSQDRLTLAVSELARERCDRVTALAREASSAVGSRPQGYELLARCALEDGEHLLAIRMMNEAVRRDPYNWRPRYGLAVARARAGRDPRAAARAAFRFNPRENLTRQAVERFAGRVGARAWRRSSSDLEIQVPTV